MKETDKWHILAEGTETNEGRVLRMSWQPMRIPGGRQESLPGDRGRYLLWLEPPLVNGEGHYVHFSWKDDSFCIRDYIQKQERRQERGATALDIWTGAADRIPAKGELYVPVENFEFWTAKLMELTESRKQGTTSSLWSRLSSKFAPKLKEETNAGEGGQNIVRQAGKDPDETGKESDSNVYRRFINSWRKKYAGFDVVEGSVGCSARYQDRPLLWVFPTYFQIAPRGKGNHRHHEVRGLRDRHFPESKSNGLIYFDSDPFTWSRFQSFVADLQKMVSRSGS